MKFNWTVTEKNRFVNCGMRKMKLIVADEFD